MSKIHMLTATDPIAIISHDSHQVTLYMTKWKKQRFREKINDLVEATVWCSLRKYQKQPRYRFHSKVRRYKIDSKCRELVQL